MRKLLDWKRIAGVVVAIGLLVLTFHNVNLAELWRDLKSIRPLYLAAAFLSSVGMNWAKGMRWRAIIEPTKVISQRRAFSLFHIGQMINLSLPILTGQVGRIVMLSKQEGLSKTFCLTTVVMEVLFDGISLILLMYLTSFIFPLGEDLQMQQMIIAAGVGIVLLFLIAILRNQRALTYFGKTKIRRRFPHLYKQISKMAKSVADGLETLKSKKQVLKVGLFSILIWLFHIGIAGSLILAFEFELDGWHKVAQVAFVIIIVNTVMLLIPLSPGNIGSFQFVVKGTLVELFGIPAAKATAFSLIMHIMDIIPVFVVGVFCLFSTHLQFRKLREETVAETQEKPRRQPDQP